MPWGTKIPIFAALWRNTNIEHRPSASATPQNKLRGIYARLAQSHQGGTGRTESKFPHRNPAASCGECFSIQSVLESGTAGRDRRPACPLRSVRMLMPDGRPGRTSLPSEICRRMAGIGGHRSGLTRARRARSLAMHQSQLDSPKIYIDLRSVVFGKASAGRLQCCAAGDFWRKRGCFGGAGGCVRRQAGRLRPHGRRGRFSPARAHAGFLTPKMRSKSPTSAQPTQ